MREIYVVQVNRNDVEAVWREAWIVAPDGANTFQEALTSAWRNARAMNSGGSLSSISKNQSSHSYAPPGVSTRTTVDNERVCLAALKFFEMLQADLGSADEEEIYNEGIARFAAPANETFHDFSSMREVIA